MSIPMYGRTRHAQYFESNGDWYQGFWRVINGCPYKFCKIVKVNGDVTLAAIPLTGGYAHWLEWSA
jgi:hypothetical protein